MTSNTPWPSSGVAVFYHAYPHYRKGVIEELTRQSEGRVQFYGSSTEVDGIKCYSFNGHASLNHTNIYSNRGLMFQPAAVKASLVGKFNTYIFLANPYHISTWLAAAACRIRGRRVIFWGHGFLSSKPSILNSIRKLFFSLANGFYTYGYRAKKNAIALGFRAENIYVGFNSLDYSTQMLLRQNLDARHPVQPKKDYLQIVCVSRLTNICRYDLLIQAAHIASQQRAGRIAIKFIGDGPERQQLEACATALGVDAHFLGAIYDENIIAQHVYDADVTVSPGKVGLTAMHSLMYGTPVISHNDFDSQMPEVEAVVSGYTGEVFPKDNVDELARLLTSFSNRYPNRALTRSRCYKMIDQVYNPFHQVKVMELAISGQPAPMGDDAFRLFEEHSIDHP